MWSKSLILYLSFNLTLAVTSVQEFNHYGIYQGLLTSLEITTVDVSIKCVQKCLEYSGSSTCNGVKFEIETKSCEYYNIDPSGSTTGEMVHLLIVRSPALGATDFIAKGRKRYKVSETGMTFSTANSFCRSFGAELAVIITQEDSDNVFGIIHDGKGPWRVLLQIDSDFHWKLEYDKTGEDVYMRINLRTPFGWCLDFGCDFDGAEWKVRQEDGTRSKVPFVFDPQIHKSKQGRFTNVDGNAVSQRSNFLGIITVSSGDPDPKALCELTCGA